MNEKSCENCIHFMFGKDCEMTGNHTWTEGEKACSDWKPKQEYMCTICKKNMTASEVLKHKSLTICDVSCNKNLIDDGQMKEIIRLLNRVSELESLNKAIVEDDRKQLDAAQVRIKDLEAAEIVLKPLMKTIVDRKLCAICLNPMEKVDDYTWKCKCMPNTKVCIG